MIPESYFRHTENAFGTSFSKKDRKNTSHLIEFQLSAIYNQLTFSNSFCEAKLVIDENYLLPAMTDLFLDLSMFNSYSFLRICPYPKKETSANRSLIILRKNRFHVITPMMTQILYCIILWRFLRG